AQRAARHAEKNREARAAAESVSDGQVDDEDAQVAAFEAAWNAASPAARRRFMKWAGLRFADAKDSDDGLRAEVELLTSKLAAAKHRIGVLEGRLAKAEENASLAS